MTDNRLRLNNSKRVALKKEHWRVVNQTPSELKDNLLSAGTRFYSAQQDAHKVIEAEVEKRYPKADLDVLRKYNNGDRNSGYGHRNFTMNDNCFTMKNIQSDAGDEVRINFDLGHDLSCALNHDKLMANKLNPFVETEYNRQGGTNNPTINTDRSKNESWLRDNFNQFRHGSYYGGNDLKNPFGLEVVNTGGCHTRAYGVQDWQWQILMNYEQSKKDVLQAHKDYYSWCKDSQDTMATVIDQAKYLDEVQIYWTDVEDSILVGEDNLSTNLAVISEDRLQKLKDMASSRKSKKSDDYIVAVNESQQQLS